MADAAPFLSLQKKILKSCRRETDVKTEEKRKIGKARKIIGCILIALNAALTIETVIVMTHRISTVVLKDDYITVFRYQLIICAALLIFSLDVRFGFFTAFKNIFLKIIGWILRVGVTAFVCCVLVLNGMVIRGSLINTSAPAEYAVVLGKALENGKPTRELIRRLETAKKYLETNSDSTLILAGGNSDLSGVTEAETMRNILLDWGVPDNKIILEDKSDSTKRNMYNVLLLIGSGKDIVLISSDYHMNRAVMMAEKFGFKDVKRLPAPSGFFTYGANMLSEDVLFLNEITK